MSSTEGLLKRWGFEGYNESGERSKIGMKVQPSLSSNLNYKDDGWVFISLAAPPLDSFSIRGEIHVFNYMKQAGAKCGQNNLSSTSARVLSLPKCSVKSNSITLSS